MTQELLERKIIKLLLKKDFYEKYGRIIPRDAFPKELLSILDAVIQAQEKYGQDITLYELRKLYEETHSQTEAAKHFTRGLFDILSEEPEPNEALVGDIVSAIAVKEKARQIGEAAARILNGDTSVSFDTIKLLVDGANVGQTVTLEPYPSDLRTVLTASAPDARFPFAIPILQEKTTGAGRENLIIWFGRPEIGKSSIIAFNNIGYLRQELRVAYFGNEEPCHKIMLNHVRAALEKSDRELQSELQRLDHVQAPDRWDTIRDRFVLFDAVGMSVADVGNAADRFKADVVVLDNADKFGTDGKFNADHERLKTLYVQWREHAKRGKRLVHAVSQASAEAENKIYLSQDMLDGSKTGKAGEADIIIGVAKNVGVEDDGIRHICIPKNKISGWHGRVSVLFDWERNQWRN